MQGRLVHPLLITTLFLVNTCLCQTPVIGGTCRLGTADVQIGGKQTQFFLKCEATTDSAAGEGVWVVKSRAAAAASTSSTVGTTTSSFTVNQAIPIENTQPQQHPKLMRKQGAPNICEQDLGARESDSCAVSATCLQAATDVPSSYLQCDQSSLRWVRKSCQDGFVFNFEQQTCIVPKRMSSLSRQQANGLLCTFSSCSNTNPCSVGTCNNGYCCSSSAMPSFMPPPIASSNCVGCVQAAPPQLFALPAATCPGGGFPVGQCSAGFCSPGFSCIQNVCCPQYAPPRIQMPVFACPSGSPAVGGCINGACATGYSCIQNQCCATPVTKNPFVCPNGNQAAGGCVNGQCGAGYTCQNGLCCLGGSSSAVRCLDGSEAVGACIPSCQGGNCGAVQISYYCGSGYTCTTGNICCPVTSCPQGGEPIGPPVNGLCPAGYNLQGSLCCSNVAATCPDGSTGTPAVNGICPTGTTLTGTVCCPSTASSVLVGNCEVASMGIGPCTAAGCGVGYACDNDATNPQCCPVVNYQDPQYQIGPAVSGMCPVGYVAVYPPSSANADGTNDGVCVDLQTVPNLCAAAVQAGPCNNGACQTGYTCNTYADICCPTTTAFGRLNTALKKRPTYGRPLHSYMPPRANSCSDGSKPAGGCINGLCGVGHECQNGLCCPPVQQQGSNLKSMCPNGELAVSGCFSNGRCGAEFECVSSIGLCCPPGGNDIIAPSSQHTIRPIGGRCLSDVECVGHTEGLSLCHAGVCQCSPIAYSQGIACVRRKHLKMNDSPMETEMEKEEKTSLIV
uniref:CC domain-containing protein n=1 Tax=Haemonchus contortus TaxID=6289 RepID=A0A7I4YCU4_HAECO